MTRESVVEQAGQDTQSEYRVTDSLRALHVISGLFYGGGQQVVLDLLDGLPRVAGVGVGLCILGDRDAKMAAVADHSVPYDGRYNRPLTLWRLNRSLRRVLAEAQPGIVHSHGWDASMAAGLALRGKPTPHVVHWHTTDAWLESTGVQHRVRRYLTRWLFSQPNTHVVAVSGGVQQHLCQHLPWPAEDVEVIWNGINAARYQPAAEGRVDGGQPLIIGTAARLAPMKGLEYLIDALAVARERGVRFGWRVAGEGGSRSELEQRVEERGLADCVRWCGRVDDMPSFYQGLDVFVLPSVSYEGLPLSILEAMATGVPVISTRISGIPEAVRDAADGLLVEPRQVEALADAIERLANDGDERQRMAASARQRVLDEFTIERAAERFAHLYTQLSKAD